MAASSEKAGEIPQFNGEGYSAWAKRFKAHLVIKGCAAAFSDNAEAAAAVDEKAKAYLVKALGETYIDLVDEDSTFSAAWGELKQLYEQSSAANYMQLRQQFNAAKQDPGEDIVKYIVRVQNLAERLKAAGEAVSEKQIVAVVLEGMLSQYDTERVYYQQQEALPSLASLRQKLIVAEQTKARNKKLEQAFYGEHDRCRLLFELNCLTQPLVTG
jgi:hypothetical protein